MYSDLATLTIFAFAFSVIAGRIERSAITGPIIYIFFGLIGGPIGLGFLDIDIKAVELRVIADLTLALVLFLDAANANLSVLRSHSVIPRRMLLIGLPLCIALGTWVGTLIFPDMPVFEVCVLATMLAATDAALGKGVVTNKQVPARVREGLNAESGLNDGMCVPVLFVFLALATGKAAESDSGELALSLVMKEIGIGAVVGLGLAYVGARLIKVCQSLNWFTDVWQQIPVVTLALACFTTAQSLHGSGYIAAFVGGLLFGYLADKQTHTLVMAGEGIAELLAMLTWVIFGAAVIGQAWSIMTWDIVLYSLLSLTVIRMLPILIALTGSGVNFETKLFLSWFGPRGLASIVFMIIVAGYDLGSESILEKVVVCTITLCVIAHGLTANVWAKRLGQKAASTAS